MTHDERTKDLMDIGALCEIQRLQRLVEHYQEKERMSETQQTMVAISQEELDRLRALQPATVTIEAAEYKRLQESARGVDPETHRRVVARLGEVERLLRTEMEEHQAEVATWKKSR
jgi:response regulator of citrate/malate metabolism